MAKAKPEVSKSQMVRDLLEKVPDIAVKDVVAKLGEKGISVTPNLVYGVKGAMGERKRRKKRVAKAAMAATPSVNGTVAKADAITMIREVKALAAKAGGYGKLKELVDALAE